MALIYIGLASIFFSVGSDFNQQMCHHLYNCLFHFCSVAISWSRSNAVSKSNCIWHQLSGVLRGCIWDLDWWMNLLTTYTHNLELQAITAPPLISTIHKSPQHLLCSPAIPWQWLLTMEILQLHVLKSYLHGLPCRILTTDLVPCLQHLCMDHIENT
jgi:hypothetical protein